ncbi:hypothetical protein GAYE_SCF48G6021 [Galdieria yellowstonensis]|uniref:Uncharacterized protein n=1 Tax=Galdieria yellowstonensis TaxID=3028027 RepID=A0AAV9IKW3_9RHOD|nr:hypothetical protein GAYE_SCF48G6021 [Galdieria yellowstonensis]
MSSLWQRMNEARKNFQSRKGGGGTTMDRNANGDVPMSPREENSSVHSEHSVASAYSDGIDFTSEEDSVGSPSSPSNAAVAPSLSSPLSKSLPGSLESMMKRWSLSTYHNTSDNNNNKKRLQETTTRPVDIPSSPVDNSPVASAPQGSGGGWSPPRKGHVEKAANVTKSFRDVWLTPD